ncbi:MAG: hypothetical protein WBV94_04950 [Blastocatellia bacterium]
MSKELNSDEAGISYTASVGDFAVLKGVLDEGALWNAVIYNLALGHTLSELYPILNEKIVKEIDMALIQLETEKKVRLIEEGAYRLGLEGEESGEYLAKLAQAIDYIRKNLNAIVEDCAYRMIHEGLLVAEASMVRDKDRHINDSIPRVLNHSKHAMSRRMRLHFATDTSELDKKAYYAILYPIYLEKWQHAQEIYNNWLMEVKKRIGRVLKNENFDSKEWKRRILTVYPEMPEDLLNRLVHETENPFYVNGIDDYDRTPSRIAALHTARCCDILDNLSYVSYMRFRREGDELLSLIEDTRIDVTDLAE